jgi:DNA-binding transcriptional MerR regulator
MFLIEDIQVMYERKAVELTQHFIKRLRERGIKLKNIKTAIMNGEIIEQYLDDYPNPSVLILGYIDGNKPLHVVVGMDDEILWLITVYSPSLDVWETDYKTRKDVE